MISKLAAILVTLLPEDDGLDILWKWPGNHTGHATASDLWKETIKDNQTWLPRRTDGCIFHMKMTDPHALNHEPWAIMTTCSAFGRHFRDPTCLDSTRLLDATPRVHKHLASKYMILQNPLRWVMPSADGASTMTYICTSTPMPLYIDPVPNDSAVDFTAPKNSNPADDKAINDCPLLQLVSHCPPIRNVPPDVVFLSSRSPTQVAWLCHVNCVLSAG